MTSGADWRESKWLWKLATALLLLMASSLAGVAQERETRAELFVQLGPSFFSDRSALVQIPFFDIPTGSIVFFPSRRADSLATATRLFVGLRYYFTRDDAVEAGYSFTATDFSETDEIMVPLGTVEFTITVPASTVVTSFNYVRYFRHSPRYGFFATGGLGFAHFSGFPSPTKFSGNLGAGVDIRLRPHVALRAEYRLFLMDRPKFRQNNLLGGPGSLGGIMQNHAPSVGIVLKF
ncbi:MAG: outer membrane beta-barrel protein [Candidatus Acidiferrales bacterium]